MLPKQEKLFSLFKEIHDICIEHDIVYYLAGGSIIGAFRHNGFIPWDDDMDIMMTRDEWNKFVEVARKGLLPEGRVLDCQELDRSYPNMVARYTDVTTTLIYNNQVLGEGNPGYLIDILMLDPIPSLEAHAEYEKDMMLYADLINPSVNYSNHYGINQKERYEVYYKRMQTEGREAVLSELEQRMFSYEEADCPYYTLRWGGVPFLFPKEMYGSSRWHVFEGMECRVPDKSSDYLVRHYGDDWMYIPPHEERDMHDSISSLSCDFKTVQKDYLHLIDVNAVNQAFIEKKMFLFEHMDNRFAQYDTSLYYNGLVAKYELEQKINGDIERLQNYLDNGEYKILDEIFGDYFALQFHRKYIGREDYLGIRKFLYPEFFDVDDRILYIATQLLVHTNRVAKAKRLLDMRVQIKGELTEDLKRVEEFIEVFRSAVSLYDLQGKEKAFEIVEKLYQQYPLNESIAMFYVRLLVEQDKYEIAMKVIDDAKKYFPENGVFDKYLGDCILQEDLNEAFLHYARATTHTQNGYVFLEIEETVQQYKDVITQQIIENHDVELAKRMLRLAPKCMEYRIAYYTVLLSCEEDEEVLFETANTVIRRIKNRKYPCDSRLIEIICQYYKKLGMSDEVSQYYLDYRMAQSVEDLHKLRDALEKYIEVCSSSDAYIVFAETNRRLGRTEITTEMYEKASECPSTWLYVKYAKPEDKEIEE